MINSIPFMGREGCIEPAAKKVAKKAEQFFPAREPIAETATKTQKTVTQMTDSIRKSDADSYVLSHAPIPDVKDIALIDAAKLAEAYKAAHGIK